MEKDSHELLDTVWRLLQCMSFQEIWHRFSGADVLESALELTRADFYCRRIICVGVILNPFPVDVSFSNSPGVVIKPSRNDCVPNQTGGEGHLECKPVF